MVGVNAEGKIFSFVGGNWQQLPGALVDVSVGRYSARFFLCFSTLVVFSASAIYGVNREGQVWRLLNGNWVGVPSGLLKISDISVGTDGTVYGVTNDNKVVRLDGASWTPVPGALVCISVLDSQNVVGCNAEGQVSAQPLTEEVKK